MPAEARSKARTMLVLRAGGSTLGLETDAVAEVGRVSLSTPLSLASRHILGFCELRGEALLLVDLAARLGLREGRPPRSGLAVIASTRGERIALLVDEVQGVVEAESPPAPLPAAATEGASACYRGILKRESGSVLVLEADALLDPQEGRASRAAARTSSSDRSEHGNP